MPANDNWLTLKVSHSSLSKPQESKEAVLMISVPKRIVKLAVHRNRLRRLIREATRNKDVFRESNKVYHFYVQKAPANASLGSVQKMIQELL